MFRNISPPDRGRFSFFLIVFNLILLSIIIRIENPYQKSDNFQVSFVGACFNSACCQVIRRC